MKEKMFATVLLWFLVSLTFFSAIVPLVKADTYNQIPLWINILAGTEINRTQIESIESYIDSFFEDAGLNWRVTSYVLDDAMEDPDPRHGKPGEIRHTGSKRSEWSFEVDYLMCMGKEETADRGGFKIFVVSKILNGTSQDSGIEGLAYEPWGTAIVEPPKESSSSPNIDAALVWCHEIGHLLGLGHKKQNGTDRPMSDMMYEFAPHGWKFQDEDVDKMNNTKIERALGVPTTSNLQHFRKYKMYRFAAEDQSEDFEYYFPELPGLPQYNFTDIQDLIFGFYQLDETRELHVTTYFGDVIPREDVELRYFVALDTDGSNITGGQLDDWDGIDYIVDVDIYSDNVLGMLYTFPDFVSVAPLEARLETGYMFTCTEEPPAIPPEPVQYSIVVSLPLGLLEPLSDSINVGTLLTSKYGDICDKLEITSVPTLPPQRPSLILDPPVGTWGTAVAAAGNGYTPGDTVSIVFDHMNISSVYVEPDGSFETVFMVPELQENYYVVDAMDESAQVGVNVFTLTFETDLNKDEKVNIQDITIVAIAYKSKPGDPNWNSIADIDNNEVIDILDITKVAIDYGKTV